MTEVLKHLIFAVVKQNKMKFDRKNLIPVQL